MLHVWCMVLCGRQFWSMEVNPVVFWCMELCGRQFQSMEVNPAVCFGAWIFMVGSFRVWRTTRQV